MSEMLIENVLKTTPHKHQSIETKIRYLPLPARLLLVFQNYQIPSRLDPIFNRSTHILDDAFQIKPA